MSDVMKALAGSDEVETPEEERVRESRFLYRCIMREFEKDMPRWMKIAAPIVDWLFHLRWQQFVPQSIWEYVFQRSWLIVVPSCPYSTDEQIFHASFYCLGRFIETELGREPSERRKAADRRLWGPSSAYYRGYRLHSDDEEAIDLWLWYRDERPKVYAEYDRLLMRAYGKIEGSRRNGFSGEKEPEHIVALRRCYRKEMDAFAHEHFGTHFAQPEAKAKGGGVLI